MSTRIRYEKTPNTSVMRSNKNFRVVIDGRAKSVYVLLDTENMKYTILDVSNNELVKIGGNTSNKTVLFRQVKRDLEKLGVVFGLEERNRPDVK